MIVPLPLPEPEYPHLWVECGGTETQAGYTATQLQTYGEAMRREALEEVAVLIDRSNLNGLQSDQKLFMYTAKLLMDIAENIRRLK